MKIDDIRAGQNIVITSDAKQIRCDCGHLVVEKTAEAVLIGVPLHVVAVSLPFAAVRVHGVPSPVRLDLRQCKFSRASDEYCEALASNPALAPPPKPPASNIPAKSCPRCGGEMVERRHESGVWAMTCRNCGAKVARNV